MNNRLMRPVSQAASAPSTLLLMHFDNAANLLLDSSSYNRTVTAFGPGFADDVASKWGASCAYTNYAAAQITGNTFPDLSTTDHTIECWIKVPSSEEGGTCTIGHFPIDYTSTTTGQHFGYTGPGQFYFNDGAVPAAQTNPTFWPIPYDTWVHVAAVQKGSCKRIFIGGVLAATATQPAPSGACSFSTGGYIFVSDAYNTGGMYIDDLRVSSRALYCSDFTPPAAPFSTDSPAVACGACDAPCPPPGIYTGYDFCDGDDVVSEYTDGACGYTYVLLAQGGCI